jgi:recombinational DNA repair protein (RecF pathway)
VGWIDLLAITDFPRKSRKILRWSSDPEHKKGAALKPKLLILSLIVLMLLLFSGIASADLYCHLCGKKITGTYYKSANGDIYCSSCWSTHKVCSQCGKLVDSVVTIEGLNFCPDCYAKLDRCSLCGKPLVGNYMEYPKLGLKVCAQCEREKPRCEKCGVPTNDPVTIGGVILCRRCAATVEFCHSCGKPLLDDYAFFEGNKSLKFCSDCVAKYPHCDNCGAPVGPDGVTLNDGRHLCPDCRRVAYFQIGLVISIRKKVQTFVTGNMGMPIKHDINFSLKGQDFLKQKAKNIHGDINGLFYHKGDEFDIYILYGLRQKDLISVIAHELTHAWQAENCPKDIPLEDQEGFAQWVAYKASKAYGYDDFADLMTEGDNIYARGLAKMLRIETIGGPEAVFDFVKTGK